MKNNHIPHIEELLIDSKIDDIIDFLEQIITPSRFSIKYDGSPSIFIGHTEDGKPFIATKSIFNKNPRIITSADQIIDYTKDEHLRFKLQNIWFFCIDQAPKDYILQGDLLWCCPEPTKSKFQSNVLAYETDWYKVTHHNWELGFVWHTQYSGHLGNMSEGIKTNNTIYNDNVLSLNTEIYFFLYDDNPSLYDEARRLQIEVAKLYQFKYAYLRYDTKEIIKKYINNCIRENTPLGSSYIDVLRYYNMSGRKSNEIYEDIRLDNYYFITKILQLTQQFWDFKDKYIKTISKEVNTVPYVYNLETNEYEETVHEGIVLQNNETQMVKIVDRRKFSYYNFSDKYMKGWQKQK